MLVPLPTGVWPFKPLLETSSAFFKGRVNRIYSSTRVLSLK